MNYWLIKSEPSVWSWQDQVGAKKTVWDGVRNHQAANNLKAMKKSDQAFFYHSNDGREIVGIVTITKEAFPDLSDDAQKFVAVEVTAHEALKKPVTLDRIKKEPALQNMALLRQSRLSVQPVTAQEWNSIIALSD